MDIIAKIKWFTNISFSVKYLVMVSMNILGFTFLCYRSSSAPQTEMENRTEVTQFILLGLTSVPELQAPLFVLFLFVYLINVVGNLGMILLILLDSHLHTPMYFFLSNLSLVDIGYSSAVIPTFMAEFLTGDKVISYNACATQMSFLQFLPPWKIFFWLPWPLTVMQQCVNHCITPRP